MTVCPGRSEPLVPLAPDGPAPAVDEAEGLPKTAAEARGSSRMLPASKLRFLRMASTAALVAFLFLLGLTSGLTSGFASPLLPPKPLPPTPAAALAAVRAARAAIPALAACAGQPHGLLAVASRGLGAEHILPHDR